jgi:uncharacterized protein
MHTAAPTPASERIAALDLLRGVAVLGILAMNIQGFAMPGAAYLNPTAYGDLSGLNGWVWRLGHLLTDQKFLTIFSILFGAGMVLMAQRVEAKDARPARIHLRRTVGLLVLGLLHAYLLWAGDILVTYALCALVVFRFHRLRPRTLLVLGVLVVSVHTALYLLFWWSLPYWPAENVEGVRVFWNPTTEQITGEIAAYQGGWLAQMEYRLPASLAFQTLVFFIFTAWRAAGLMLIGMALYKMGILSALRSRRFYLTLTVVGFTVGLPLITYGIAWNFAAGWSLDSMYGGSQFNYWGAPFVSLAYIGIVMLVAQSTRLRAVSHPFRAVGRMALSNYILQTLVCTTIFYGHGLGLFGEVERTGQVLIVLIVWVLQLIVSPLWLRHFRFGPLEWLWRSWTYRGWQPMLLVEPVAETTGGAR